jgi:hypothetical protein
VRRRDEGEGANTRGNATTRRFPMNGKRGPRNFYKGKNARNLGYISSKGGFQINFHHLSHPPPVTWLYLS